jgi:hypothetical protein
MASKPPVILTARKPRPRRTVTATAAAVPLPSRIVDASRPQVPSKAAAELEEHQRRGETADELFRELVRRATGKQYRRVS